MIMIVCIPTPGETVKHYKTLPADPQKRTCPLCGEPQRLRPPQGRMCPAGHIVFGEAAP